MWYLDRKTARNLKTYQKLGGAFKCLGLIAFGVILLDMVLYGIAGGIHGIYAGIAMAAIILGCNLEGYERPASRSFQPKPVQAAPPSPAQAPAPMCQPKAMSPKEAFRIKRKHTWGVTLRTLGITSYAGVLIALVTN